jgi:hypothetical protein
MHSLQEPRGCVVERSVYDAMNQYGRCEGQRIMQGDSSLRPAFALLPVEEDLVSMLVEQPSVARTARRTQFVARHLSRAASLNDLLLHWEV